ncbi:MAG TPA: GAF domain-containing sensor histidine kinase [Armatimonadota bacterium]
MSERRSNSRLSPLTIFVGVIVVLAVVLPTVLLRIYPPGHYDAWRLLGLAFAGLVLHALNQLNFTIRFSGQPDNVELTFTEAALVALFFNFDPGVIVLLSGLAHFVREMQAHRRRKIQVVFNTSEIMVSVALAGLVFKAITTSLGGTFIVAAIVAAMLTHSIANRLLVGTVISLNAGKFHSRYYKSLFVENVVMLFMNLAVGMTAVMAFLLDRPYLLWVPMSILAVVYVAYQAYIGQMRDANTLARLYENGLLTSTATEATLIPLALSKILDTFSSREVRLAMAATPDSLAEWRLDQDDQVTTVSRRVGSLRETEGAQEPVLLSTTEPAHAIAWRRGARLNRMAAPVEYEGQLMGVLRAEKPRAWDAFTPGDLRAFALFARQLGVALENTRLTELDREQQRLRQRALDAERNRISRDLHDSFVQSLVQVDLHLAYLVGLMDKRPDAVRGEIEQLQKNVRAGLVEARSYMAELKPLRIEPGEFCSVAQRYLDEFGLKHRIPISFETDHRELDLGADDLSELFAMMREGLNNVAKHASATCVRITVNTTESHVELRVQDDGVGFDTALVDDFRRDGHFGLANICERANGMGAAVDWASAPGKGTTLTILVPRRIPSDILKGVPV